MVVLLVKYMFAVDGGGSSFLCFFMFAGDGMAISSFAQFFFRGASSHLLTLLVSSVTQFLVHAPTAWAAAMQNFSRAACLRCAGQAVVLTT